MSHRQSWFKEAEVSALYRADNPRTADGPVTADLVSGQAPGVGVYLTNEVFLYRVIGFATSPAGEMVELEDCYWLDVVRVPATDVRSRRLRVVTPATIPG